LNCVGYRTEFIFQPRYGSSSGDFSVAKYRAYVVGADGHFISFRAFACDSDADATTWAKQLVDGHDIELWSGPRLVIRISHKPK
jgi:hypothetical protein